MTEVRAVALAALAVVGIVAAVAPAPVSVAGPVPAGPADAAGTGLQENATERPENASVADGSGMGDEVSTFMQASSGEADESVEAGMWVAAYEEANGSERAAVVERRTVSIRSRLAELRAEKRALEAARENGTIGEAEYRARLGRLTGRIAALNRSIETTERQANESGADAEEVRQLRRTAANLTGPEVAAIARGLGGGPGELPAAANGSDRGPPDDAGPPEDAGPPGDRENGTADDPGGPPGDQGDGSEGGQGEGEGGPPDDPGGPPDDGGGGPGNASDGG